MSNPTPPTLPRRSIKALPISPTLSLRIHARLTAWTLLRYGILTHIRCFLTSHIIVNLPTPPPLPPIRCSLPLVHILQSALIVPILLSSFLARYSCLSHCWWARRRGAELLADCFWISTYLCSLSRIGHHVHFTQQWCGEHAAYFMLLSHLNICPYALACYCFLYTGQTNSFTAKFIWFSTCYARCLIYTFAWKNSITTISIKLLQYNSNSASPRYEIS